MSLANEILGAKKQKLSELTLVPSDGGRFEVTVDGKLVYSKLATGRFPEWKEIQKVIV